MVALRAMPRVRLTEPKWRILLSSMSVSSTSSGIRAQSAPRTNWKLRSPALSTATMAIVVGLLLVHMRETSTPLSVRTWRR